MNKTGVKIEIQGYKLHCHSEITEESNWNMVRYALSLMLDPRTLIVPSEVTQTQDGHCPNESEMRRPILEWTTDVVEWWGGKVEYYSVPLYWGIA